jgi:hypothetical protein
MEIELTPEARNYIQKKGGEISLNIMTVGG